MRLCVKHKRDPGFFRVADENVPLWIFERVHIVHDVDIYIYMLGTCIFVYVYICVRPIADNIAWQNAISLSNREDRRRDEAGEIARCFYPPSQSILLQTIFLPLFPPRHPFSSYN